MKIEHPYLQSVADNDRQRPWGDTEDSTMSEKTITRYRLCNDVYADRYEHGIAQPCWDALKNQTDVVLVRDHEAALAAAKERIAELEEDRKGCWREFKQLRRISEKQLTDLRTTIEAKAAEWELRWRGHPCATELRTLLGDVK